MFHKKPYFDRRAFQDRDIVLCETTNWRASKHAAAALTQACVSYSKKWKDIPFLLRRRYKGSHELCVISINRNEYARARRAISDMEPCFYQRLRVNLI